MNDLTVCNWLTRYEKIVTDRVIFGLITEKTKSDYTRMIKLVGTLWGGMMLSRISVADISSAISHIAETRPHSARRFRLNLSDLFKEAQREGILSIGHNPAIITREPFTRVATNRLTMSEWSAIFCRAESTAPDYFVTAMLFALVTAQRRSDITSFHSNQIFDGHLHIKQQKTGEMIALPLDLRLDVLDISLSDVINMSSKNGYLLRHANGKPVNPWNLSYWFKRCRDECLPPCSSGKPPPFREQRSLAERLYRDQGIDTRTLLGHRYQSMTDQYNDLRGRDYRRLAL